VVTARVVVESIVDPELRELTIAELGILREVREDGAGGVAVTVTPTYSGCPAMDLIRSEIRAALHRAGFADVSVHTALEPAWSTDMISETGRAKLAAAGIAPPGPARLLPLVLAPRDRPPVPAGPGGSPPASGAAAGAPRCPRCGAARTERLSPFGATPCKALWRCRSCAEPFEGIKPL
jgi:ring-1,2-phenylacetyl-CoA epoxidase subunit PaaD